MRIFVFLCVFFFSIELVFCQLLNNDYIITSEQNIDGTKRRDIFYTKNYKKVSETYFYQNKKFASIRYNQNDEKLIDFVEEYDNKNNIITQIDFIKGTYEELNNELRLFFKDRFVFDGKQEDFICDVTYKNGSKSGKFNQKSINIRYDEFGGKASWQVEMERKTKDLSKRYQREFFNELSLNFENNVLNGLQTLLSNSKGFGFNGFFNYGKVVNYQSFLKDKVDNKNKIISSIKTDKNFIFLPQIINGTLWQPDGNYVLYFQNLSQAGSIVNNVTNKEYFEYEEKNSVFGELSFNYNYQQKSYVDSLKIVIENFNQLRRLLGIPKFKILKYSVENNDEIEIIKLKLDNCIIDTSKNSIILFEQRLDNNIFYLQPPFKNFPYLSTNFNVPQFTYADNSAFFVKWFRTSYNLKFSLIKEKYPVSKDEEEVVKKQLNESILNLFQQKTIKLLKIIGESNNSSFIFINNQDTLELVYNYDASGDDYYMRKTQLFCKLKKNENDIKYYSYNCWYKKVYYENELTIDSTLNSSLIKNIFLNYPGTINENIKQPFKFISQNEIKSLSDKNIGKNLVITKSDCEKMGLKGKVKSIYKTSELKFHGNTFHTKYFFDTSGNLIRANYYEIDEQRNRKIELVYIGYVLFSRDFQGVTKGEKHFENTDWENGITLDDITEHDNVDFQDQSECCDRSKKLFIFKKYYFDVQKNWISRVFKFKDKYSKTIITFEQKREIEYY
jgi:hypothetical protein